MCLFLISKTYSCLYKESGNKIAEKVCRLCKQHFPCITVQYTKLSFFITSQSKEPFEEIEYAISCIPFSLVERNYYLVNLEEELWPGQLIKVTKSGAMVRCLHKAAVLGSI